MILLSMKRACERLGVHPNTLRRWIKEGGVRAVRTPKGIFMVLRTLKRRGCLTGRRLIIGMLRKAIGSQ